MNSLLSPTANTTGDTTHLRTAPPLWCYLPPKLTRILVFRLSNGLTQHVCRLSVVFFCAQSKFVVCRKAKRNICGALTCRGNASFIPDAFVTSTKLYFTPTPAISSKNCLPSILIEFT